MSEMPQDPFVVPETLGMMRGMFDLYSAGLASGFPEHVAIEIIVGVIVNLLHNAAATPA
jgi:hypothetical protein